MPTSIDTRALTVRPLEDGGFLVSRLSHNPCNSDTHLLACSTIEEVCSYLHRVFDSRYARMVSDLKQAASSDMQARHDTELNEQERRVPRMG
jgi:hypothetical protein